MYNNSSIINGGWAAANSIWKTGHENLCKVCNEGRHRPSECPSYKATGPNGGTRVACVCCLGIGHRPAECWILEAWVEWAAAFLQLEGPFMEHFKRVADRKSNSCFICLQDGHTKGRCSNTKLVAEFGKFKTLNHTVQRHSDSKSRWTNMVTTSDQGSCISHTQRKFVRPNLRMVLTDFMLNNCGRAAAKQQRWDELADVAHRVRSGVDYCTSTEKPKKEPPVAGYDFVPATKAEEMYKRHSLAQALLCIGRKIPLLYQCDEETGVAALHLTHRPVLHGPLVPTGEPPLSTYKYK